MDLIVKMMHGSYLYGLETPTSDKDYKGVFAPSAQEILEQKCPDHYKHTTGDDKSKNGEEDIDTEYYSVKKFLTMVGNGQTGALEMLFAPKEMILESTLEWDAIVKNRDKLVSSQMKSFIGYCRSQAGKYGAKGERMATIKKVITFLDDLRPVKGAFRKDWNERIDTYWNMLATEMHGDKYVHFSTCETTGLRMVEICGRKFQQTIPVEQMHDALVKIYGGYGARAKKAETSKGADWKALSHALRVSHQAIELLDTQKITLPLKEDVRNEVMKVKLGEVELSVVEDRLDELLLQVEEKLLTTKLPEKPNYKFIDHCVRSSNFTQIVIAMDRARVDEMAEYYGEN